MQCAWSHGGNDDNGGEKAASNFDRFSSFVPDKISFAPLNFICFAIEIPIPPVAPVINATLPLQLNMNPPKVFQVD